MRSVDQYNTNQGLPARPAKFGGLAWTALILGIVGIVGSPIIFLNNLTAVVAGVGVILGIIALFGTRKGLAGAGVALCVAAIVFTVLAQDAAVEDFDQQFGTAPFNPAEAGDVVISACQVVNDYGFTSTEATIVITNSTDEAQSYLTTISVENDTGARIGEINAVSNSLAPGQSVTLSGMNATGTASPDAEAGPARCVLASVDRFAS